MSRSDPIIPRSELTPGIERCVAQATKLFESSRVLLNAGMVDMAAVNYALGVQEVGKAQLLREGFDSGISSGGDPRLHRPLREGTESGHGPGIVRAMAYWWRVPGGCVPA